jgi:hypothetical protein
MPVEYALLENQPVTLKCCPRCGDAPFYPFMRGLVQNWWRKLFRRPYCCLICAECKEIVGYEDVPRSGHSRFESR